MPDLKNGGIMMKKQTRIRVVCCVLADRGDGGYEIAGALGVESIL